MVNLPIITPMLASHWRQPFDHADWLFEIKHDGFRTVAFIEDGHCRFISRNGYKSSLFPGKRAERDVRRVAGIDRDHREVTVSSQQFEFFDHGCSPVLVVTSYQHGNITVHRDPLSVADAQWSLLSTCEG
jgi:hypothetical protein